MDVAEEVLKVRIFPDTERYFQIGTSMNDQEKIEILLFLLQNVDFLPGVHMKCLA